MCRGTKPWRFGCSTPLCQGALEAKLAGDTLSRVPGRKSVPTGAICGCLWDTMGCYGGQWETIVNVWDFRDLFDCGKMRAHAFGTKQDRIPIKSQHRCQPVETMRRKDVRSLFLMGKIRRKPW